MKRDSVQGDLFTAVREPEPQIIVSLRERGYLQEDIDVIAGLYSSSGIHLSGLMEPVRSLFKVSFNAFDDFIHAWMSELPIEAEMFRFCNKVVSAAELAAQKAAASDRGDPDVRTVLEAADKVRHEIDRLRGLLRFKPDTRGLYIARCEPDHFALPALGEHFTRRFGETPWAIIDEKRGLCLCCLAGEPVTFRNPAMLSDAGRDEWEELWRHYHKTINNESRKNPGLQRQFMPKRYWKHLTEM